MSDALLIAAHGSRDESGVDEFHALAEAWGSLRPDRLQASGFLEFARPTISEAIDDLADRGARRIVVVPAMLMAAGHVKNDVPSELEEARRRHPELTIVMARALEIHSALLELCHRRYLEALAERPVVAPERTLLLLVGRGTSDPDANANIARVSRFLWESYGVGWASVAYSGLAEPSVDHALTVCRRLGFDRIVVQPYFLFDGILLKRIRETAERHAMLDPAIDLVCTAHLRTDPLLIRAFEDRVHEAVHGLPHMNCDLCKYRVRLIGREADLGSPQVGHHHHVRAGHDHDDREGQAHGPLPDLGSWERYDPENPGVHPWDRRLLERLDLIREPGSAP